MADHELEPLLEEYKQLFTYSNSNAFATLSVPPAFLVIIAGFAIYKGHIPPLFGLGVAAVIFVILTWLGYCHSMLNGIGLRLVDIEQRINRSLKLSEVNKLSFHTDYIAHGANVLRSNMLPGFNIYSMLIGLTLFTTLIGALYQFWMTMTMWNWGPRTKVVCVIIIAFIDFAPAVNMYFAERKTRILKKEIIKKYSESNNADSADAKSRAAD